MTTAGQKRFKRIESIDVIRGLTILVMIFVNDIGGVPGTPA
jgi:predicted acyltransferase